MTMKLHKEVDHKNSEPIINFLTNGTDLLERKCSQRSGARPVGDFYTLMVDLPDIMVDLPHTMVYFPDTMVELPDTMVDLPDTMVDLPDTMVDLLGMKECRNVWM